MSQELFLRTAEQRDLDRLAEFGTAMAMETENKKLSLAVVSQGVKSLFNSPQDGFYVVAEVEGEIVGSLKVTFEWSEWRNGVFWWIQNAYVQPEFRRQRVFRKLYEYIKTKALTQANVCGLRLYVEKDNDIAQNTYLSLGMQETNYKLYEEMLDESQA